MNNNDLIHKIKAGDKFALEEIYTKHRSEFINWMTSVHKTTASDAKDLYQQSIIVLYENIVNGKLLEMNANIKTYLYAVGKNKFSELKRHSNKTTSEIDYDIVQDNSSLYGDTEKTNELIRYSEKALQRLGNPCKELLEFYYYHKKSMHEITELLGYKNEGSARNQKYKCLIRLKEIFHEELKKNNIQRYE